MNPAQQSLLPNALNGNGPGSFPQNGQFMMGSVLSPVLMMMQNQNEPLTAQKQLILGMNALNNGNNPFNPMLASGVIGQLGTQSPFQAQPQIGVANGVPIQGLPFKNESIGINGASTPQPNPLINTRKGARESFSYTIPFEIVVPSAKSPELSVQSTGNSRAPDPHAGQTSLPAMKDILMLYQNISSYANSVMKFKTRELVILL